MLLNLVLDKGLELKFEIKVTEILKMNDFEDFLVSMLVRNFDFVFKSTHIILRQLIEVPVNIVPIKKKKKQKYADNMPNIDYYLACSLLD